MTTADIASYLGDNTDIPDQDLLLLARRIYYRLDYSCMYSQIDNLVELLYDPLELLYDPLAPAAAGGDQ
jgi:hypothetical protein